MTKKNTMNYPIAPSTMRQRALLLALAAAFACACATTEHSSPSPAGWAAPPVPTGPSGPTGVTGTQGATGNPGANGLTQLAGVSRPGGYAAAEGPMAANGTWSVYRSYTFNAESDGIARPDNDKARDVATYASRNPSYRVGIDGYNARHVSDVRSALIEAGVPPYKIQTGAFGDPQARGDRKVAVLLGN
jgi:hypothetical protein